MTACTGAALSSAYIIVYCVVAALSAYACYYALDSGGLVGSRSCYGLMVMTPYETGPLYIYMTLGLA